MSHQLALRRLPLLQLQRAANASLRLPLAAASAAAAAVFTRCRCMHTQSQDAARTFALSAAASRPRCSPASTAAVAFVSAYSASAATSAGTAALSLHSSQRRSVHSSARRDSFTGISFSPVPPAELKVAQWLKAQEIAARRKAFHAVAARIWSAHPSENWSRLDLARSVQLLTEHSGAAPTDWDSQEFLQHTLKTKCEWRFHEMQRERKRYFEAALERMMKELRAESDAYKFGTMEMTKNELTRKLTVAMQGKLPSADEVDEAWQARGDIPAIEWKEDAI